MAILKNGINGAFSGKVGNVVGYELYGKSIIRSIPTISKSKKASKGQAFVRNRFKNLQIFLSPLVAILRIGFAKEGSKKRMSAFSAAMSTNLFSAMAEDGTVCAELIKLSLGELPTSTLEAPVRDDVGIHVSWQSDASLDNSTRTDLAMIVAYNPESKITIIDLSVAKRNSGQCTLEIPEEYAELGFHIWIAFSTEDRKLVSDSSYFNSSRGDS